MVLEIDVIFPYVDHKKMHGADKGTQRDVAKRPAGELRNMALIGRIPVSWDLGKAHSQASGARVNEMQSSIPQTTIS